MELLERQAFLESLEGFLASARGGRGCLVLVAAEPTRHRLLSASLDLLDSAGPPGGRHVGDGGGDLPLQGRDLRARGRRGPVRQAQPPDRARFNFWHPDLVTLHVWLWYHNPDGLYSGTNPLVRPFNKG